MRVSWISVRVTPGDSRYETAIGEPRICEWFDQQFEACWSEPEIELTISFGKDFPESVIAVCRKHIGYVQRDIEHAVELLDARDAYSGGSA